MTATFNIRIINNTIFMYMTRNLLDFTAPGVCLFGLSLSDRNLVGDLNFFLLPPSLLPHPSLPRLFLGLGRCINILLHMFMTTPLNSGS